MEPLITQTRTKWKGRCTKPNMAQQILIIDAEAGEWHLPPAPSLSASRLLWRQRGHTHPGIPTAHTHTNRIMSKAPRRVRFCAVRAWQSHFSSEPHVFLLLHSSGRNTQWRTSMVLDSLSSPAEKLPLFFQDHRHTKSFSDRLKIGLSLWFYYYCSIDGWWNWPRKAIWVKVDFFPSLLVTSKG